jgi:hypothetical protein
VAEKADLAEEIATLKAEIVALEEELAKMDAAAATPADPDRRPPSLNVGFSLKLLQEIL